MSVAAGKTTQTPTSADDRRDSIRVVGAREHNLAVIEQADWIVDLGPDGCKNGGEVVFTGAPEELVAAKVSLTGEYMRRHQSARVADDASPLATNPTIHVGGLRMTRRMTEQERQEFLAEPHVGVLSVASDDDRPPLTVPVWYGYEPGGDLTFFTGTQGRKARKTGLIQNAGVLSLCVQREEFPYKHVTVEGTVVQEDRPPSAEQMLAIIRRYLPEEAALGFVEAELENPSTELVLFTIRPDRWLTADFSEEDER